MQKKVLAAVIGALLASPAVFADSANVTISGRFAAGVESYKVSGGTAAGYNNELRVSDQSSSLVFSGSEDLGGGLKGFFQIDNRFTSDNQGSWGVSFGASGNTLVGLQGDFGKIGVGKHDLHYNEMARLDAPRAGSLQSFMSYGPMAQVNGSTIANGTRTPNLILWDSPNWGGITARVGFSTQWSVTKDLTPAPGGATGNNATNPNEGSGVGATDAGDGDGMNLAVRYSAGPLFAGISYWDAETEGSSDVGDQESMRAFAAYTLPFGLKVGLGYDTSEIRVTAGATLVKRNAILIPVSYTFGANTVYFNYADIGKLKNATTTDQTDATAMMVGYDRALSKRTFVGAYYSEVDNKQNASYDLFAMSASGGTTTATGEDAKQIYLGVTHLF